MISRVKIKIESVIDNLDDAGLPDGESERSVDIHDGVYRYTGDGARISYNERLEGAECENEILVFSNGVTVRRRGGIYSDLHFKEGESHTSLYRIPPYSFDCEIMAKRVTVELCPTGGKIDLRYNMKIGGAEKSAIMRIWISKAINQA